MLPNHNKGQQQQLMVSHTAFTAILTTTQTNTTSTKNFIKVLQLNANGICNKTDEIQLPIRNTQADVITIQETKLNQSHKTPNISHFTPIRTDCTHKQGEGLLTFIKNNISFSQFST